MEDTIQIPDVPDLSGVQDVETARFEDGWYGGTILAKREFTDRNGNDRVFESTDAPSQNGDSRNIQLQVELTRQSDKRTYNARAMVNYRPEDLSAETVQQVMAQREKAKDEGWGSLFRPFMTLMRLGKLQRIAGVRQLQRNGNGGLDLTPTYGKSAYFRLGPDDRNPEYKAIVDFSDAAPKGVKAKLL